MEWLLPLYIGATIFGVGITIADLFGAFSNLVGGESGGDVGSDSGGDTDIDGIEADGADGADDIDDVDDVDADEADHAGQSILAHDARRRGSAVLKIMTGFRSLVYFSLGFGPVGWFAISQYGLTTRTLAWSLPVGAVVMVGTRMLRSFMRKDLSSDVKEVELIMEKGVVTVSIKNAQMGKVRIIVGGAAIDRYARAMDKEEDLLVGTQIRVVDISDECVLVEKE
jgi:membrane protein implicated in regulation of membrane protease activity